MVDAVDSLLNNAVDFYVQAVDYCRISTSQIPTPVDAGIRQIKPESGDVQQMLPDSRETMPDSGRSGWISSRLAGSGLDLARTGRPPASSRIRLFWPNLRPGRSASGQLAGIRPFLPDSGNFAGICICQI
jgi:hypothetical protein